MVGKQKKPRSLTSSCSGKHTQKIIHHEGKVVLCTGSHCKQWKAPEGKESWPESARMSEASQAHWDRWFHAQLMRVLTLTLFSHLTFSLSENTLCVPSNSSRIQTVCWASTYLRENGGNLAVGIYFIIYTYSHLYIQSEKINPKPPMRQEMGYRGRDRSWIFFNTTCFIDLNLKLCKYSM